MVTCNIGSINSIANQLKRVDSEMFQKITLSEVLSLLCNDFCAILERQSPYNVLNYCSSVDHHSCAQLEQRPETSPPVSETL